MTPTDYVVRVASATQGAGDELPALPGMAGNRHKPIGLLQEFGENDSM